MIYQPVKIFTTQRPSLEMNRIDYIRNAVYGKSVLHAGCSDYPITIDRIRNGTLLHSMLIDTASRVVGIDLSQDGINVMRMHGIENVYAMNAETMNFDECFDIILAGDVLEHMNNPGMFLERATQMLNQGGEIIIGVPNALTFGNIKGYITGVEQVHMDHTFYFSPKTLSALCARYGLKPTRLVFTTQPREQYESWLYAAVKFIIMHACKMASPSIIMHFRRDAEIDKTNYTVWL